MTVLKNKPLISDYNDMFEIKVFHTFFKYKSFLLLN